MNQPGNSTPKSPTSHLHVMNLVVALLAGVISITGGIYSLKNNVFSGPAFGSLQGIVRDERIAKPLKLATVEISDLAGAVVNTATTDDDGRYLIESLKTGNYAVKFTAALHKVETKTIKIEKNLTSSINVDLVPEISRANPSPGEYAASVQKNIPVTYTPAAVAPVVSGYNVPQNNPAVPVSSPVYSRTEPMQDPALAGPPRTGYRRHPRRNYSENPVDNPSGVSQSTSQGDVLTQAGTQLLQAWLNKKLETGSSNSSSTTTN